MLELLRQGGGVPEGGFRPHAHQRQKLRRSAAARGGPVTAPRLPQGDNAVQSCVIYCVPKFCERVSAQEKQKKRKEKRKVKSPEMEGVGRTYPDTQLLR